MGIFAKDQKAEVEVEGGVIYIRKLSGRSLEKAAEQRTMDQIRFQRAMGVELLKGMRNFDNVAEKVEEALKAKAEEKKKPTAEQRYAAYDRHTVLTMGIDGWSFPVPKDDEHVSDLDEASANKTHKAILDLSLPPIDKEEVEAATSKDSGASISS